jgi:hypothetical protein
MRPHRIGTWALSLLVAVGWLGMPGGVWGQQTLPDLLSQGGDVQVVAPASTSRTFGTADTTALVIGASEFDPLSSLASWAYFGSLEKTSNQIMVASVRLPAGALVHIVELEGCDTDGAAAVTFTLLRIPSPSGPAVSVPPTGSTGGPDKPGCGFFPVALNSAFVIDNQSNTYVVQLFTGSVAATVRALRIYYTLQVSPAPAVASFGDVPPSHQFFRFIEALAASGITSGCQSSPPLYCPDQALTRGQMAVFLSKALGLHFAP